MALLIIYVLIAIGVSFLCSIMEAVLLSVTPSYVGALAERKPRLAARIKVLKEDIDRPLAAILTLNTVAHTVGAAGAGAQAAKVFGDASLGVFSAVLTLAILLLSEIIPKTLGAVYWRRLTGIVARLLVPLIWLTYPLVLISQLLAKLISGGKKDSAVSREEIAALAQIGADEGVFDPKESRILQSLLRFHQLVAKDVMTPRTVMISFPEVTTIREVAEKGLPFSRLPIYEQNRDHISGYVLRGDVLAAAADGRGEETLESLERDVQTVPLTLPLPKLFDQLLNRREHIAVVVDEYGGTAGLATMEDVVETLLGLEIVDEADVEYDMQAAARERWEQRARRLGLLEEHDEPGSLDEAAARERDAGIRLGITGGQAPAHTDLDGEREDGDPGRDASDESADGDNRDR